MNNDKVADFIIRIKNAAMAKRKKVILSHSKLNKAMGRVLVKENFLEDIREETKDNKKILLATIRYEKRLPVLSHVVIVSKPSLRSYTRAKSVTQKERRNMSTLVISTNKGVMTGKDAKKQGVGGEVLFEVW
ncbi:30S ribosomal protein S8 [Candidatus Levyibacteriota bacterium]|nr:30S ribosomal protein S8 [Candidatus Levybacteria bacterium]MSU25721.1 30S ribosomal protein S8 [Candidatus Levybacteria bacterium]GDX62366.1 30S ribosomal protein S8 [Candidatus Levybacteria bacterium]